MTHWPPQGMPHGLPHGMPHGMPQGMPHGIPQENYYLNICNMKVTLEITDEQLLDVIALVKSKGITAVFEGALLLEVGKKYKNRKGEEVTTECEESGVFRIGTSLYYANGM